MVALTRPLEICQTSLQNSYILEGKPGLSFQASSHVSSLLGDAFLEKLTISLDCRLSGCLQPQISYELKTSYTFVDYLSFYCYQSRSGTLSKSLNRK